MDGSYAMEGSSSTSWAAAANVTKLLSLSWASLQYGVVSHVRQNLQLGMLDDIPCEWTAKQEARWLAP